MKRLTDRIAYEDRNDELHVVNRLPFLPAAAAGYFALAAICLACWVSVLFIPGEPVENRLLAFLWMTVAMLPMALWILFLALWSLRGEERLQVGGGRLTVQRRLGRLKLRQRVFEIRQTSRLRGEPYTLPGSRRDAAT